MSLEDEIGRALGASVEKLSAIGGGDINEAWRARLADGREVFVKSNRRAPADMFETEARGLAWLRDANALRIPDVLHIDAHFLVLELLEPGPRQSDFDARLGQGLALLHQQAPRSFGLEYDNFIGRLPQPNGPRPDWPTFYREQRLEVMVERAGSLISSGLRHRFERLFDRLDELLGPDEPPARLHGDLWGGNLHCDEKGLPALIDPAVYGGHREIDLAMMKLFGGFSARTFSAYDEAYPLAPGWEARVPLYQLYPLLVHVNLFGGGYLSSVERALRAYE